ncbi:MAG: hypothetical protein GXO50_06095 [Chlorobi bacterium]|nr:hypothetical protein [Chlorobiota bacterium]
MNKLIRNFIFKITVLTALIALISGLLFFSVLKPAYFEAFPLLLILFPVISVLMHIRLLKASQKSLAAFNVAFMLGFMIKLIIYATFTGIIISAEPEKRNPFVITVLLLYIIYTVFDTKAVLDDMKKLNPDTEK